MTSLRALIGKPVIARDTADRLGSLDGIVVDPEDAQVVAIQLGANTSSRFLTWNALSAVGGDAIIVESASSAHEAMGTHEERAAAGIGSLLGKRLLDSSGDEHGTLDDLEFDDATGAVDELRAGGQHVAGSRLLGIGSYAVVVSTENPIDDEP